MKLCVMCVDHEVSANPRVRRVMAQCEGCGHTSVCYDDDTSKPEHETNRNKSHIQRKRSRFRLRW